MSNLGKLKVRVLTFHQALNYGAVLQAYALCKTLNDAGYDAKVSNYLPYYFAFQIYRPAKGIKKSIEKLRKIIGFYQFRKKNLPTTEGLFFFPRNLGAREDVHAFICGSDQIWNKKLTSNNYDDGYFLNFETHGGLRIAYAASSGGEIIANDSYVKQVLHSFDSIGVREASLSKDINANSLTSTVVLDPSLLIKDYDAVISYERVPQVEYILTYVVGSGETLLGFNDYVEQLKKKTNLIVLHIGSKGIASSDMEILDISPGDWVGFFKRAAFVVTNSFHGTAFSINFEKQFLFYPHGQRTLNQRQETLLKAVNLENRNTEVVGSFDSIESLESIDYTVVTPKLSSIVETSRDFLLQSLGK
mgnify:CR=1 FL=1